MALLVAATLGTWWWTQTQYFVGEADASVVVFRGVNTQLGPMKFYRVVDRTGVKVSDLKPAARDQIDNGITANSRAGADAIVTRLKTSQLLPLCSSLASTTTTPSPTPVPSTGSTTPRRTTTPLKTTPGKTKPSKTAPKTSAHRTAAHKSPPHTTVIRIGSGMTVTRIVTPVLSLTPSPSAPARSTSAGECR